MKVNKRFVLAGVSLASALLLTACGGGSSNQSTYSYMQLVQQLQMSQVTL